MDSGRKRVLALVAAVVLVAISAALIASAAAGPPALKYACASNLYNARNVLHYVAAPSQCSGGGKTLVTFSTDFPVYVCRKEHGGFAARPRRFQFPNGIRGHGPAGLIRLVNAPRNCALPSQPNETAMTLPGTSARLFCAANRGGELRFVLRRSSCLKSEFVVRLAKRPAGASDRVVANPDSSTTDEETPKSIGVLGNDTGPRTRPLRIQSTDTTGTKGVVTVNGDGTIGYSPNGQFNSLKQGESATDTFKYRVTNGARTSGLATVTVTVGGVNDAPVATGDNPSTQENQTKQIAVLSNDTDADGDSLTVASIDTTGTQGTVTNNGDGTVTYNPNHHFDSLTAGHTAHDTFKYKANDGHTDSNAATVDVTITGVSDPPVVTTTAGSTPYTEGNPATTIDGGVTVSDPDDTNLESAQVRVSSGFQAGDDLVFVAQSGISGAYNAGTGVLTLTGTASVSDYQAAVRSIKFSTVNDNPSTPKTIEFKANDGDADSNLATKNITVTGVNDAPTLTASAGQAAFTEGGSAAQVDPGLTASDPDSAQLQGAVVSITSNFSSADGDSLNFTNQNGISGLYNSSTGVLTMSGNASVADYQTALRSITFSNTSSNPSTATRTVSFKATDTSSADSNTVTRDVTVTATQSAPVVTTSAGATSYTEGDPATTIDGALTVTDADDTNLESAQVRFSSGFQSGDNLVFVNQNGISGVYNSTTGILTMTGTASKADYQTAFRSIQYRHDADNPSSPKVVEFKANDGDADSNLATKNINVTGANDAPTITTTGASLAYTEGDGPVAVDSGLTLTDPDSTQIQGATVQISGAFVQADDELAFTNTANITGAYNDTTGTLTLSGTDTVANYQAALRSVTFENVNQNPSGSKTIAFQATDAEGAASSTQIRIVNLTNANDAPVVTTSAGNTNWSGAAVTIDASITVSDVDDTNIESARVRISSNFSSADSDSLNFTNQNGISGVYNSTTGILTMTGTASKADYQTAFRSIQFNTTNASASTSKTVEFKVNDGDADSNLATKNISLN